MKMGYEKEFLICLQSIIGEIEKKVRRGHARLALNQAHSNVGFELVFSLVCWLINYLLSMPSVL